MIYGVTYYFTYSESGSQFTRKAVVKADNMSQVEAKIKAANPDFHSIIVKECALNTFVDEVLT